MNPWSDWLRRLGSEHETDGLSRFPGSCYDKSAASSSVFMRRFAGARTVVRIVSSYPGQAMQNMQVVKRRIKTADFAYC